MMRKLLSVLKSIYINFKIFDFETAIKLPLLLNYNTELLGIRKGCIVLESEPYRGMISIGINRGTLLGDVKGPSVLQFGKSGCWYVKDKAWIAGYGVINVGGRLRTEGFSANAGLKISCAHDIFIGNDVLIGWDVLIIDSDGHQIIDGASGKQTNVNKAVFVGNHVWLCAKSIVLKGSKIPSGSILAMNSYNTKQFTEENIMLMDNTILRNNVTWAH